MVYSFCWLITKYSVLGGSRKIKGSKHLLVSAKVYASQLTNIGYIVED